MAEQVVIARRIVVGMDGSHNSIDAFEWYMKNVHRPNDFVIIGFCPNLSSGVFSLESILPSSVANVNNALSSAQENANQIKAMLEEKLKNSGAHGSVEILSGSNAGHALVKEAEKEKATMLIIGSRGHGVIRRTVLGSVSGYIMHHSQVPVLVHPHIHHHHHHHHDNKHKHGHKAH